MSRLKQMRLWMDAVPRSGPENMAIDEWLANQVDVPVLRIYQWQEGWGSLGYFVKTRDLPDWPVQWVRRWTGGGIVDHRSDWTYTLMIPRGEALAEARGAESYRLIHQALADEIGEEVELAPTMPIVAGGECFTNPVDYDLMDVAGHKVAGAGQRRNSRCLLHQGSVSGHVAVKIHPLSLACRLSDEVVEARFFPDDAEIQSIVTDRYGAVEWLKKN
jgi:lipoyl(octanoyl) transferase